MSDKPDITATDLQWDNPDTRHEDHWDCDTVECGRCGDDGWINLSDAGPGEWGEDCFNGIDRPIACPECKDRRKKP